MEGVKVEEKAEEIKQIEYRKYMNFGEQYMVKLPKETQEKIGTSVLEKADFNLEGDRDLPEPTIPDLVTQTYDLELFLKLADLLKKIQRADAAFKVNSISIGIGKERPLRIEVTSDEYGEAGRKSLAFWLAPRVDR